MMLRLLSHKAGHVLVGVSVIAVPPFPSQWFGRSGVPGCHRTAGHLLCHRYIGKWRGNQVFITLPDVGPGSPLRGPRPHQGIESRIPCEQ
jgi:hypothetical protein